MWTKNVWLKIEMFFRHPSSISVKSCWVFPSGLGYEENGQEQKQTLSGNPIVPQWYRCRQETWSWCVQNLMDWVWKWMGQPAGVESKGLCFASSVEHQPEEEPYIYHTDGKRSKDSNGHWEWARGFKGCFSCKMVFWTSGGSQLHSRTLASEYKIFLFPRSTVESTYY